LSRHVDEKFLFSKQVGMCARSFKANRLAVHAVNQNPVRLNMKVTTGFSFAFQRVIVQLTR
jgi:hypothetical protein